ncbi:hypothetical protein Tco_1158040 [Tanacetum coccineum]
MKARSLLLMALPNEHQFTFSQYNDAKTMFAAIETRFGGNEATKKTQKTLLKQQYENLIWMNKAEIETMSIDDLYNNFKIVEQNVKKSVGTSSGSQNLAFMTTPSTSSTNDVNTAKPAYEVSNVNPNVNTASSQDLEKINEDDLEAMDLKWQLSLLSMRAKRKHGNNEDTSSKAMLAIDGVGFDWSDMAEEQASKDLRQLLGSQITNKSKKSLGYNAFPPPHPLIDNRPKKLDLSYSGLDEFKEPESKLWI